MLITVSQGGSDIFKLLLWPIPQPQNPPKLFILLSCMAKKHQISLHLSSWSILTFLLEKPLNIESIDTTAGNYISFNGLIDWPRSTGIIGLQSSHILRRPWHWYYGISKNFKKEGVGACKANYIWAIIIRVLSCCILIGCFGASDRSSRQIPGHLHPKKLPYRLTMRAAHYDPYLRFLECGDL